VSYLQLSNVNITAVDRNAVSRLLGMLEQLLDTFLTPAAQILFILADLPACHDPSFLVHVPASLGLCVQRWPVCVVIVLEFKIAAVLLP